MDGEGYLGLARIRRRNRTSEYCLRVSIYNSNLAILKEIQRTVGGTMSDVGQRRPAWKPSYALIWTNAAAAGVVRRVSPFLRIKSQQGAALLAFNEHIRAGRRLRNRAGHLLPLSVREVKFREGIYRRLKRLNRKGPVGRRNREGPRVSIHQAKVSPKCSDRTALTAKAFESLVREVRSTHPIDVALPRKVTRERTPAIPPCACAPPAEPSFPLR